MLRLWVSRPLLLCCAEASDIWYGFVRAACLGLQRHNDDCPAHILLLCQAQVCATCTPSVSTCTFVSSLQAGHVACIQFKPGLVVRGYHIILSLRAGSPNLYTFQNIPCCCCNPSTCEDSKRIDLESFDRKRVQYLSTMPCNCAGYSS